MAKANEVDKREDVDREAGLRKYGNVEFADPVNHKYPIDTEDRVRAAWSYINQEDNAAKYNDEDVKLIKERIRKAAEKFGVEIHAD
jgi:hypothetical protein